MDTALPIDDDRLYYSFKEIASYEDLNHFVRHMAGLIVDNNLTQATIKNYLSQYSIRSISEIKHEMLDLLILYLNLTLNEGLIDDRVKSNFTTLKMYFKIKEGDFYEKKNQEIQDIIQRQLDILYGDNILSPEEAMIKLDLQEIFDLSYAQFQKLKAGAVERAIEKGADPKNLNPHVSLYTLMNK